MRSFGRRMRDDEAIEIAARFPSASRATVEVWPTRQLLVTE
ncbi:MAG: hypothetical protein ACXW5J_04755 [Thermoanaerobaculia bacterium]